MATSEHTPEEELKLSQKESGLKLSFGGTFIPAEEKPNDKEELEKILKRNKEFLYGLED